MIAGERRVDPTRRQQNKKSASSLVIPSTKKHTEDSFEGLQKIKVKLRSVNWDKVKCIEGEGRRRRELEKTIKNQEKHIVITYPTNLENNLTSQVLSPQCGGPPSPYTKQ